MNLQEINFIDIFIITLMVSSSVLGVIRGFIKESLAFLGWGLATFSAVNYGDEVSTYIGQVIGVKKISHSIAYGGVFITTLLVWNIISYVMVQVIKYSGFSYFDKFLGSIFGFLRGSLFISLLVVIVNAFGFTSHTIVLESKLYEYFIPLSSLLASYIPDDMASSALQAMQQISLKDIVL